MSSIAQLHADDEDFPIPKSIPWSNWRNWAYKHRATLLNWCPNAPIPSKGFTDFKNKSFSSEMLEKMVRPRDRQAGILPHVEDEDEEAGIRVVRWTEGMIY